MITVTTWRTDEPYPACATSLLLLDDSDSSTRAECLGCGYADTWTSTDLDARDAEHPGWSDQ